MESRFALISKIGRMQPAKQVNQKRTIAHSRGAELKILRFLLTSLLCTSIGVFRQFAKINTI